MDRRCGRTHGKELAKGWVLSCKDKKSKATLPQVRIKSHPIHHFKVMSNHPCTGDLYIAWNHNSHIHHIYKVIGIYLGGAEIISESVVEVEAMSGGSNREGKMLIPEPLVRSMTLYKKTNPIA